jgi:hypothetical protein
MTADIEIGTFRPVKPSRLKYTRSVDNFSDTCTVYLPAISMLRKEGDTYERVSTGLQFAEGMPVRVYAGYNDANELRFQGFIRRINFSVPLEVECEGYAYLLRKKISFTKTYKNTTVRKILEDVTSGTAIRLSDAIPHIPLESAVFKRVTGLQVLEWLKEKCLLTVYFNYDELYCGALQLDPKQTRTFRLGWNVVKDNELKFNTDRELADVRIEVGARKKDGTRSRGFDGKTDGEVKVMRSAIRDENTLANLAAEQRRRLVNRGYEGSITAFLQPLVEPGMAVNIEDQRYPQRNGKYFVETVDGEFGPSGGRQKIKIGAPL